MPRAVQKRVARKGNSRGGRGHGRGNSPKRHHTFTSVSQSHSGNNGNSNKGSARQSAMNKNNSNNAPRRHNTMPATTMNMGGSSRRGGLNSRQNSYSILSASNHGDEAGDMLGSNHSNRRNPHSWQHLRSMRISRVTSARALNVNEVMTSHKEVESGSDCASWDSFEYDDRNTDENGVGAANNDAENSNNNNNNNSNRKRRSVKKQNSSISTVEEEEEVETGNEKVIDTNDKVDDVHFGGKDSDQPFDPTDSKTLSAEEAEEFVQSLADKMGGRRNPFSVGSFMREDSGASTPTTHSMETGGSHHNKTAPPAPFTESYRGALSLASFQGSHAVNFQDALTRAEVKGIQEEEEEEEDENMEEEILKQERGLGSRRPSAKAKEIFANTSALDLTTESGHNNVRYGFVDGLEVAFRLEQNVTQRPKVNRLRRLEVSWQGINAEKSPFETRLRWWLMKFNVVSLCLWYFFGYILLNAAFAGLWTIQDGKCCDDPDQSYTELFDFSIQTSTTIGYGGYVPIGTLSNFLVVMLDNVTFIFRTIFAGLLFLKFVTPSAKIQFSDIMTLSNVKGIPCLEVRVGNADGLYNELLDVTATLTYEFFVEYIDDDNTLRRLSNTEILELVSDKRHRLVGVWTLRHVIDETSPLFGLRFDEFPGSAITGFRLSVTATQDITKSPIIEMTGYQLEDIMIGHRFLDQSNWDSKSRTVVCDYSKMDATLNSPVWYPFPQPQLPPDDPRLGNDDDGKNVTYC